MKKFKFTILLGCLFPFLYIIYFSSGVYGIIFYWVGVYDFVSTIYRIVDYIIAIIYRPAYFFIYNFNLQKFLPKPGLSFFLLQSIIMGLIVGFAIDYKIYRTELLDAIKNSIRLCNRKKIAKYSIAVVIVIFFFLYPFPLIFGLIVTPKDITEFNIPIYPDAYEIYTHRPFRTNYVSYQVKKEYLSKDVMEFYEDELSEKGWIPGCSSRVKRENSGECPKNEWKQIDGNFVDTSKNKTLDMEINMLSGTWVNEGYTRTINVYITHGSFEKQKEIKDKQFVSFVIHPINKWQREQRFYNEGEAEYSQGYSDDDIFWEYKHYGGGTKSEKKLKPTPEGNGYITGKFIYNNKPAVGIRFSMHLNNKYKTKYITTNKNGAFTIRLRTGEWYVNTIKTTEWLNKPNGKFVLISGDEAKIKENDFQSLFYSDYNSKGKEVIVTDEEPEEGHIVLMINPRVNMTWPKKDVHRQNATINNSKITWDPYPKAKDYVIQINRITRKGSRSTIYSPIIYKRISGDNFLSLSDLSYTNDPTAREEYSVDLQAYGEQGELLSESKNYFKGTFILTDGNKLLEDKETGYK